MLSYDSPISTNGQKPPSADLPSTMGTNPKPVNTALTPDLSRGPATNGESAPKHQHVWIVTGPAGCGKSTVAQHLSSTLGLPYLEGDEFHPKANIDKMANGQSLTDADRWDWLTLLREESLRQLTTGAEGVVVTCSALKRKYRDVIRVAPYYSPNLLLHFIYLHAPEPVLQERVGNRQGHYMGAGMVRSQFAILQPPTLEETDVISIDVSGPMAEVQREALDKVLRKIDEAA